MVPAALRHRDFSLFWGGVVLSAVGSQFTTVAMAWQMYELTNSALQIGLLGLARAVPQIALALLGGLMADAMERRRLIMGTQIAQLTVPVALAGLTLADAVAPYALYIASALLALTGTLETPAGGDGHGPGSQPPPLWVPGPGGGGSLWRLHDGLRGVLSQLKQGTWKINGNALCLTLKTRQQETTTECYEVWMWQDHVEYRQNGVTMEEGFVRKAWR